MEPIKEIDVRTIAAQFDHVSQLQHAHLSDRVRLANHAQLRIFDADTFVAEQGMPADTVQVILQGQVHVTSANASGRTIWLWSAGPCTMLDPIALLEPPLMPYSIRTLSEVQLVEIERDFMLEVIQGEPRVGFEMMHVLAQRLHLIGGLVNQSAAHTDSQT